MRETVYNFGEGRKHFSKHVTKVNEYINKMNRKIFITVLLLFVSFTGLQAQTIIDQGTCGDSLTWVLTSDSTLTINGNGAMDDYINGSYIPWYSYRTDIAAIIFGDSVTNIGNFAFCACNKLISVIIGNSVTIIGNYAFYSCNLLTSILIGNTTAIIGNYAFSGCSQLRTIMIPNSVTTIGNFAFSTCSQLRTVTIPNSVTTIGNFAFSSCSQLRTVTIPNSVTTIGQGVFSRCSQLTSVTIPNSITKIERYTFESCHSLISVTIPNSVTTIGLCAFTNCIQLASITIPNSVTTVENAAFAGCSQLISVMIPDSVTTLGDEIFYDCIGLTSVTIPNSVTTIGDITFEGCNSLTSITIPNSVTAIGNGTFRYCTSLNVIICKAITPPVIHEYTFGNVPVSIPVFVPCNAMNAYKTANYWNVFTNFVEIFDTTFIFDAICLGEIYNDNGFIIEDGAGIYYRTETIVNNCDSIICLALSTYPFVPITHYSATICQGNVYSDDNFTNLTQAGDYYDTLQNVNGCDSIIHLQLEVVIVSISYYSAVICQGKAYSDDNFTNLTQAGDYYDTLQSVNGCDSIVHLYLEVITIPIPLDLIVTQVGNNFFITWQGNANSYELYRNNTLFVVLDTATSYIDTNLVEVLNYCYVIKAIDGDCESELSEEVCLTFNHTDIAEQQTRAFRVYPNPTNRQLKIENGQLKIEEIEIFDVIGRRQQATISKQNEEITIDISHLLAGVYLMKIKTEHGIIIQKIVKN